MNNRQLVRVEKRDDLFYIKERDTYNEFWTYVTDGIDSLSGFPKAKSFLSEDAVYDYIRKNYTYTPNLGVGLSSNNND
jgi:hypothetical protein